MSLAETHEDCMKIDTASHQEVITGCDLDAIKEKLRQIDVLSGYVSRVAEENIATIAKDLTFNDAADLVAEVGRLRGELEQLRDAARAVVRSSFPDKGEVWTAAERRLVDVLEGRDPDKVLQVVAWRCGGCGEMHPVDVGVCPKRESGLPSRP